MRDLVTVPNKVLNTNGRLVVLPDDDELVRELRKDMTRVMKQRGALGITACQLGVPIDFFVINPDKLPGARKFNYFINAELVSSSGVLEEKECCLSIPGKVYEVKRHQKVVVKAMLLNGEFHTRTFSGLTARCIQQEMDHARGVLISDKGVLVK